MDSAEFSGFISLQAGSPRDLGWAPSTPASVPRRAYEQAMALLIEETSAQTE